MTEYALYCLTERCVGCGACVVACLDQNDLEPETGEQSFRRLIQLESDDPAAPPISYVSLGCRHCRDAACLKACPSGAIRREPRFGAVLIDEDKCLACGECVNACPEQAVVMIGPGRPGKCDLCHERLEAGLKPACVKVCPFQALVWSGGPSSE